MPKSLDSELYGDIYGEEDTDPLSTHEDTEADVQPEDEFVENVLSPTSDSSVDITVEKSPFATSDAIHSLPPKPTLSSSQPQSLSYSAQIAQQFSAYRQTPSQERLQRKDLPPNSNIAKPGNTMTNNSTQEGSTSSSFDCVFGKKPSEMHDTGKLFIGGLNWDTTDEGLRSYFSQFGKVDAVTIMRDPSGTSRGFAFLTFEDEAAVKPVLTHEHILDGKTIDPKRAIPREEHLRNTRYFVGGLSPTSTSETMREFFSGFGKVVDATVMVDRETGRSKGFGFVTYEDASNADQLVGKVGLILDDKQIEVKMAQPRSQRDQARMGTGPGALTVASAHENAVIDPSSTMAAALSSNMAFVPPQNQMSMMFQRNQMPAMMGGGNMGMMNMNPMAMAAMGMGGGMGGFNPMAMAATGMNGMNMMGVGGGMNGMNGVNAMNSMNTMGMGGAMRLGLGPMGMVGMGGGMMPMGMGMRPNVAGMGQTVNPGFGRMGMNVAGAGVGPARVSSRGQHNFHPYSR